MPAHIARAGSRGKFRKVPESSGACWCSRFGRRVLEGSGEFRCVLAQVAVEKGRLGVPEFRRAPARAGVCSEGKFRKVPGGSGKFRRVLEASFARFQCVLQRGRRQVPEGSGRFRL